MDDEPLDEVPALTAAQMREVDRAMIEDLHIDLVQMMENAGRNLADLALRRFEPASVMVLAGPGGNGGGGLVAARHLSNRGADVRVVLSADEAALTPVPAHQLDILRRMGVEVTDEPAAAELVIDALIGYSIRGDPHGGAAELIEWANRQSAPVLALDTPSGLDLTTGHVGSPSTRAAATMTLALPKAGLLGAAEFVGELYVADISVPPRIYGRLGLTVPALFTRATVVRLDSHRSHEEDETTVDKVRYVSGMSE